MTFYVTTPIYYVNDSRTSATRTRRSRPTSSCATTGSAARTRSSSRASTSTPRRSPAWRRSRDSTPQEYADRIVEVWKELPQRLNASPDFFIRTSDDGHKAFVQDFLQRIYDNGDIYQDVYAGLYCVGCEAFKSEAELVDGLCPDHGIAPEYIEETNYFFRLSAYQERLLALVRRPARLRAAGLPRQRGTELHRGRAAGLQHQPCRPAVGHSDSVGHERRSPTSGRTRSSTT